MVLSVIIVNYRVRYFLELCLFSVQRALTGIGPSEVIVVDNASADGSIEALRSLFPAVRFIENSENVGFARANNQALRLAVGEYILFLNPDTVLPEDFFMLCLDFMRSEPHSGPRESRPQGKAGPATRGIGAMGVRMIDGGGRFLPESRRGFPRPWVAFSKLAGLSTLFPRSRFFATYYLGHLAADRAHPAPVLSGACMLVRRVILEEVGGFDDRFFMYAEDIDLSYRIEKAGYENFYFPGTTIVHFKGESTQKDIRYVRMFYKAMSQFRRKHFNRGLPAVWNWGMELAIWVRAGLGSLGRAVKGGATGHASGPASLFITGDAAEAAQVKGLMGDGWVIVSNAQETSAVLLCEGPDFSFRNCISALEKDASARSRSRSPQGQGTGLMLFHAAGSRSAVGSADRAGHGKTLVF
ncbi:MAG TPA: glycosyltransferase family 2 protein [Puia sp.]|nr:glycosyltransferase family 2 protein [Puia sp.]